MIVIEGRLDVDVIDSRSLANYMDHRKYTVRALADEVERELRKDKKAKRKTCSKSTIGHLRSGLRKAAAPEVAAAIEVVLGAPSGSLFRASISNVSREVGRRRTAA